MQPSKKPKHQMPSRTGDFSNLLVNALTHVFTFLEITSIHLEVAKVCSNWHLATRRYGPDSTAYRKALQHEQKTFTSFCVYERPTEAKGWRVFAYQNAYNSGSRDFHTRIVTIDEVPRAVRHPLSQYCRSPHLDREFVCNNCDVATPLNKLHRPPLVYDSRDEGHRWLKNGWILITAISPFIDNCVLLHYGLCKTCLFRQEGAQVEEPGVISRCKTVTLRYFVKIHGVRFAIAGLDGCWTAFLEE